MIRRADRKASRRSVLVLPALAPVGAVRLFAAGNAQSSPQASTRSAAPAASGSDTRAIDAIYESGFLVRAVSRQDPTLIVTVGGGGARISDAQWNALAASRDQIVELDLRRSHIADADLAKIGQLSRLKRLHLEGNDISDAGVVALAGLKTIEYLNLYGNTRITDASVDRLAAMTSLKRTYLAETGITPEGLKGLRAKRAELVINGFAAARANE
jgi:Leucine-rich repeat (LRR) protein